MHDPQRVVQKPSEMRLQSSAQAPPTRTAAEQFTLEVANFYIDVRPRLDDEAALRSISSAKLPEKVRRFIVQDKTIQRETGTGRHVDQGEPLWIRSTYVGAASQPSHVAVEIAVHVLLPGLDHSTWFNIRADTSRAGDSWRLTSFAAALVGPDEAHLSPAEERSYLTGAGWRRLRPPT